MCDSVRDCANGEDEVNCHNNHHIKRMVMIVVAVVMFIGIAVAASYVFISRNKKAKHGENPFKVFFNETDEEINV